jgi:hypothetical protein
MGDIETQMEFWKTLWTLVWFAGMGIFAVLSVIITVQGAKDLKALLQGLRVENSEPPKQSS